ncbi:transcriptional regulator [Solibacillus silvestris StLB046]|uniref:Transcriptional regulator n=1 Tax=Solibacillus silvestris (strain StLB046) TaxID=1002809 RepID=F2F1E6_SOLSS|nr:LysR family transcriptional regulator [Solibacillus silvestris]OBW57069.1 transcriptional regulator [Solibacillus silvestris]BAK15284.1 transcriptional regulator [Solibacillus silvestris StLB046]
MKEDLSLEYLLAIQEYGNISHAANALFVSQPYLSTYIKNLESKLGVELLNRQVTPLVLTYAGELYISYMQEIHEMHEVMMRDIEALNELKKGRIVLGINPILASHMLYDFLPEFMDKYPGIEIQLEEGTANEMEALTLQNKIDICISMLPIKNTGLVYEKLYEENIYLVIPKGHIFYEENNKEIKHIPFPPSKLNHQKFILLKPGLGLRRLTDNIFDHYAISPTITLETNNIENAFRLANKGIGMTIIPECIITRDQLKIESNLYTLGNPVYKNSVVISYKKDVVLSHAASAFLKFAKKRYLQF